MLTIIVKGTDGCNFNCSYCSLGKKDSYSFVSKDKLIEILDYACRIALAKNENQISFIFHGGEPTLIAPQVYSEALQLIEERYPQIKKQYSMQTNAGNLSEELLEFLDDFNVQVGVSIDGSKNIHDAERKSLGGFPTFETVSKNVEILQKHNIPVSCLMVLTSNAFEENYDYLKYFSDRNLHLKINPLLNYGEVYEHPELSLKPGEYSNYIIGMFEYILKNQINVSVSPIDKILYAIINQSSVNECTFNPRCQENFLCIDYRGDIYPCGKYSDLKEYRIANIKDGEVNIFENAIIKKLISRRTDRKPSKCKTCQFAKLCNAACNAEASIDGRINCEPLLCVDYSRLFEYFSKDGLIIYKKYLLKRKEELLNYEL